ncbi:Amine oxidase [Candidatus Sulfopaludibacter sp. SbA4]|nr:Amine oxidase [Candidatus Sulfopaludibacter sp. SbA4]
MPPNILIAGAGLAGLSTAYELTKKGYSVQVLEAQGRPGGRVQTMTAPFADGLYADAGAMSFLDIQTTVLQYVHEFDLPVDIQPAPSGGDVFSINRRRLIVNGGPTNWPVKLTPEEQKLGFEGIQQKYLVDPCEKIGDPTQPGWPTQDLSALDAISATQFLRNEGASEGAIELLSLCLIDFFGEGLDSNSALFLLVAQRVTQGFHNIFCIRGGQEQLPRAIADRIKESIHYSCVVNRIEQGKDGVTVYFDRAGIPSVQRADYAVCAIPFSVLRNVAVSPPFSAAKTEVIQELPNTSVTRVYVQTRTQIWNQEKLSGDAQVQFPLMLVFPAYFRESRRGILESYTAGHYARELARMSDAQRSQAIITELTKLFPGIKSVAETVAHKCWDEDPYALGAYAWYKPGQFLKFLPHLATPEGRVFFAGDHTGVLPGWMEGALQSGIRAAAQIEQAATGSAAATAP